MCLPSRNVLKNTQCAALQSVECSFKLICVNLPELGPSFLHIYNRLRPGSRHAGLTESNLVDQKNCHGLDIKSCSWGRLNLLVWISGRGERHVPILQSIIFIWHKLFIVNVGIPFGFQSSIAAVLFHWVQNTYFSTSSFSDLSKQYVYMKYRICRFYCLKNKEWNECILTFLIQKSFYDNVIFSVQKEIRTTRLTHGCVYVAAIPVSGIVIAQHGGTRLNSTNIDETRYNVQKTHTCTKVDSTRCRWSIAENCVMFDINIQYQYLLSEQVCPE